MLISKCVVSPELVWCFWLLGDELPCDMRIPSDKQDKLHGCLEHLFNQVSPGVPFGVISTFILNSFYFRNFVL